MHAHTDIEVRRHLIYTSSNSKYCNINILSTYYRPYLNQEKLYDNEFQLKNGSCCRFLTHNFLLATIDNVTVTQLR